MMNQHQFQYLPGVNGCLPDLVDESLEWRRLAQTVTSKGHGFGGLTEHGILQVALSFTQPFSTRASDRVKHIGTRREYPCPDRGQLIDSLATELWAYEMERRFIDGRGKWLNGERRIAGPAAPDDHAS